MNKLKGFPPVYCISVKESYDRRRNLYHQFNKYKINPHFYLVDRFNPDKHNITGSNLEFLSLQGRGPATSHILINNYWLKNTSHEYVAICEDDLGLFTVDMWSFTWLDFFARLPQDWECLQLSIMRENTDDFSFKLHNHYHSDYGLQIYLIKREYAQRMLDRYFTEPNHFHFDVPLSKVYFDDKNSDDMYLFPIAEHIVFACHGKCYSVPMFFEDLENTISTVAPDPNHWRYQNYKKIYDWWKQKPGIGVLFS